MASQTLCCWLMDQADAVGCKIHDADAFQSLLVCSRMRADRSEAVFSLAVFSFPETCHGDTQWDQFAEHLQTRMRATDHLGVLQPNQLGADLWDTDEAGAWRFVEHVLETWNGSVVPTAHVYVYPSKLSLPSQSNWTDEGRPKPSKGTGKRRALARTMSLARAEPIELLFCRSLPRWKRLIDVIGASVGLLAVAPLLAVAAILVKLTSAGPIFFRQQRDGLGGKPFTMYKFRTMRADSEELKAALRRFNEQDGPAFKMRNDPRVTTVGRYLRKSCIDELPQLWNVLKGDMTLVGPRPLERCETEQISGWGRRRLEVTPGLTCIWQVYGKPRVTFAEWMRMDIRYLRRRTLLRDVKLILSTFLAVVMQRVAH